MRILWIEKWKLRFWGVLFCLAFICRISYFQLQPQAINSKTYQIRQSFPPLFFLPDYEQGPPVHSSSSILIEKRNGFIRQGPGTAQGPCQHYQNDDRYYRPGAGKSSTNHLR